jgi:hypothetical protein
MQVMARGQWSRAAPAPRTSPQVANRRDASGWGGFTIASAMGRWTLDRRFISPHFQDRLRRSIPGRTGRGIPSALPRKGLNGVPSRPAAQRHPRAGRSVAGGRCEIGHTLVGYVGGMRSFGFFVRFP